MRLPQVLLWECSSASPGVRTVKGTWLRMLQMSLLTVPARVMDGGVPPGPLQLSRNGSWAKCSALASKAMPRPQGWAAESPWCFRTRRGRAPCSALQPGWHKWCRNLSRLFFFCTFFHICWSWLFHKGVVYLFCKQLAFFAFFLKIILFNFP